MRQPIGDGAGGRGGAGVVEHATGRELGRVLACRPRQTVVPSRRRQLRGGPRRVGDPVEVGDELGTRFGDVVLASEQPPGTVAGAGREKRTGDDDREGVRGSAAATERGAGRHPTVLSRGCPSTANLATPQPLA